MGQTGRCVNERLKEHRHNCGLLQAPGHLATHCSRCTCYPVFEETDILHTSSKRTKREVVEAFTIRTAAEGECISAPSIALTDMEIKKGEQGAS